jgi:hypothetical protein
MQASNRDSPDGGLGEAEIAPAGSLLQVGCLVIGCERASERIGPPGRAPNNHEPSVIERRAIPARR